MKVKHHRMTQFSVPSPRSHICRPLNRLTFSPRVLAPRVTVGWLCNKKEKFSLWICGKVSVWLQEAFFGKESQSRKESQSSRANKSHSLAAKRECANRWHAKNVRNRKDCNSSSITASNLLTETVEEEIKFTSTWNMERRRREGREIFGKFRSRKLWLQGSGY